MFSFYLVSFSRYIMGKKTQLDLFLFAATVSTFVLIRLFAFRTSLKRTSDGVLEQADFVFFQTQIFSTPIYTKNDSIKLDFIFKAKNKK